MGISVFDRLDVEDGPCLGRRMVKNPEKTSEEKNHAICHLSCGEHIFQPRRKFPHLQEMGTTHEALNSFQSLANSLPGRYNDQ